MPQVEAEAAAICVTVAQAPATHRAGQALPHLPQFFGSCWSATSHPSSIWPLQSACCGTQVPPHLPLLQVVVEKVLGEGQTLPQAPQLSVSVCRSAPPQGGGSA